VAKKCGCLIGVMMCTYQIVDGNMIVKMAVKDTPALLGNKLKQYYHKGDNYFEVDVDVGSSSIARSVMIYVFSRWGPLVQHFVIGMWLDWQLDTQRRWWWTWPFVSRFGHQKSLVFVFSV
jgi:hypothetical protein